MPVLTNIAELATCPPNDDQADIGLIRDAALVYEDSTITWTGPLAELPEQFESEPWLDCGGGLVIPGLIDCHTHLCFGGWRSGEFEQRIEGASYLEIARAGGGIASTVSATRAADQDELTRKAGDCVSGMADLGVTTIECKSGYGLTLDDELKQLRVYAELNQQTPIELVPTFLGAHIIPPEYKDRRNDYVALLCDEMIPVVAQSGLAEFCDIYIDDGAYTVDEGRRILDCARQHSLGIKVHAEQIANTGAAVLAGEMGARSAEHLEYIDQAGINALAKAGTVAVTLPLASLYLRENYTDARALIANGIPVAVATDFNPGSAPSYHLPFALLLACLNQQMTPAEALKGATANAARAIGRESRLGSLLPGYQADVALMGTTSVNQWLYHTQANACEALIKRGEVLFGFE